MFIDIIKPEEDELFFLSFNHSHSVIILPLIWWNTSLVTTNTQPVIIYFLINHSLVIRHFFFIYFKGTHSATSMYLTSSHSIYGISRQHVEYAGHSCKPMSTSSCDDIQLVPDSKFHGANMGPIWVRQDPGGPHVGPMNLAIWGVFIQ